MIPAARLSAAIEILDRVLGGTPAEQALTNWARGNRFAGSGDRHAIRDLVFDALRCKRSYAALGGAETGRGLILGGVRAQGADVDALFTGVGHAPGVVLDEPSRPATEAEALDCPDWLLPLFQAALGADHAAILAALRQRAPVFLRVNAAQGTLDAAMAELGRDGVVARPHPLAATALEVVENARKVHATQAYLTGLVELQDAASQAVVQALPLRDGMRVLDYCAGGGGKTLAMAARAKLRLFAHDAEPRRMQDLPARAARAGVAVRTLTTGEVAGAGPYDLVLIDVPCSGSGSWRRAPEAKWALTPARLQELCALQAGILDKAAGLVAAGGTLAYATCSMLSAENTDQIVGFLARNPAWVLLESRVLTPLDGGDGFFHAILTRNQ